MSCENKDDTNLQDLEWIHLHKTAALLKVSATAGAILAGATEEDVKNLEIYAEKIGLAFQIADDILDVTATSEELGKTAGKDEEVNKTTYVKLLGLEESKKEGKSRLVRVSLYYLQSPLLIIFVFPYIAQLIRLSQRRRPLYPNMVIRQHLYLE